MKKKSRATKRAISALLTEDKVSQSQDTGVRTQPKTLKDDKNWEGVTTSSVLRYTRDKERVIKIKATKTKKWNKRSWRGLKAFLDELLADRKVGGPSRHLDTAGSPSPLQASENRNMNQHPLFPQSKSWQENRETEPLQLDEALLTRSRSENLTLPGPSLRIDTSMIMGQRSPRHSLESESPVVRALDLSSSENSLSSFTLEREKFRRFERQCSEVNPGLFMSGDSVAKSHELLVEHGITHVVNCVGFTCGEYHKDKSIKYLTLYLEDSPNQDIGKVLYHVFEFIEAAYEEGGKVLVHCTQGISRSAALCIAYIMYNRKMPYEEAFKGVKAIRGVTNPNIGFTCQLLHWQKQLSPESREQSMYNIAPFSRLNSKMLVLKSTKRRAVKLLDPRGVFVVEGQGKIFVWSGSSSTAEHKAGSQDLVAKLLKYEIGQNWPVETIQQGDETREFLMTLGVRSQYRSLKKLPELEIYDKDYSLIFQSPSGNLF